MTSLYLFPYNSGSASAKALAQALEVPVLRRQGSKFVTGPNKVIVNWGSQSAGDWPIQVATTKTLNAPARTQMLSNKKNFFQRVMDYNTMYGGPQTINIPSVFFNKADAYQYWTQTGTPIFARTILNGHSGAGIVVLQTEADWDNFHQACNLFTAYVKKATEYRVHFREFRPFAPNLPGAWFFAQRKATHQGQTPGNHMVRNLQNGYIYVNEEGNVQLPLPVLQQVERFLHMNMAVGNGGFPILNFGAIDIIYNKHYNSAYILEVNTAPGLSGLTIQKYAEQFKAFQANT